MKMQNFFKSLGATQLAYDVFNVKSPQQEAAEKAEKQQRQDYQTYRDDIAQINSRENIFSPEQLQAQSMLFPLYWGYVNQANGANDNRWLDEQRRNAELKVNELKSQGASSVEINKILSDLNQQYSQAQTGRSLYDQYLKSKEAELNKAAGAERGAADTALRNSLEILGRRNALAMGNATSGHIMQGGTNQLLDTYQRKLPQIEAEKQMSLGQWKSDQAQQGMNSMMSMSFGQPMGNLPYTPPEPPTPNYFVNNGSQDALNSIGNLATMYIFNKAVGPVKTIGQQVSPQVGPGGQLVWPGLGRY